MIPSEFVIYIKKQIDYYKANDKREHTKFAMLASIMVNLKRKKGSKAYKIKDFMPKEPQTDEQMYKVVQMWNKLLGGEDRRNGSS